MRLFVFHAFAVLGVGAFSMLLAAATPSKADTLYINLHTDAGKPGSGGTSSFNPGCYCGTERYDSPVYLASTNETIDFGQVTLTSYQSGPTPDAGPSQGNLYISDPGVVVTYDPIRQVFLPWNYILCSDGDNACDASGIFSTTYSLIYSLTEGESIQLSWFGPYSYTPAVPLPATWSLFAWALFGIGFLLTFNRGNSKNRFILDFE